MNRQLAEEGQSHKLEPLHIPGDGDIAWVRRFLIPVAKSDKTTFKSVTINDAKNDKELLTEIMQDIDNYDADRYRSELLRIREANRLKQVDNKQPKPKPKQEYQCKKRLKTMSLLKNKVNSVKVEDKYLTNEQIYNQAKALFKEKIDSRGSRK